MNALHVNFSQVYMRNITYHPHIIVHTMWKQVVMDGNLHPALTTALLPLIGPPYYL